MIAPDAGAALPPPLRPIALWRVTLLTLMLLLAWDASGLDLPLQAMAGGPDGFAWRHAWLTDTLLHDGGRRLALVLMAGLAVAAWRAHGPGPGPRRPERLYWLAVTLLAAVMVPALKRLSDTSCPWDLDLFGGAIPYVSHWHLGLSDGGPGHCFPSGHAVSAFAFFSQYFLWRRHDPARARAWLLAVLAVGAVFGLTQMLRGAHFVSHTLWSAWLCWLCAVLAASRHSLALRLHSAAGRPLARWGRPRPDPVAAMTDLNAQG